MKKEVEKVTGSNSTNVNKTNKNSHLNLENTSRLRTGKKCGWAKPINGIDILPLVITEQVKENNT